jgi:hypothetical protein
MSIVVGAGKAPARTGFLTGKVTPIQIGERVLIPSLLTICKFTTGKL